MPIRITIGGEGNLSSEMLMKEHKLDISEKRSVVGAIGGSARVSKGFSDKKNIEKALQVRKSNNFKRSCKSKKDI